MKLSLKKVGKNTFNFMKICTINIEWIPIPYADCSTTEMKKEIIPIVCPTNSFINWCWNLNRN